MRHLQPSAEATRGIVTIKSANRSDTRIRVGHPRRLRWTVAKCGCPVLATLCERVSPAEDGREAVLRRQEPYGSRHEALRQAESVHFYSGSLSRREVRWALLSSRTRLSELLLSSTQPLSWFSRNREFPPGKTCQLRPLILTFRPKEHRCYTDSMMV